MLEVWAGPSLAPDVWMQSGQEQPTWPLSLFEGVGSSSDADFDPGGRYLVGATRDFETNVCTVEKVARRTDLAPRPDGVSAPSEGGLQGADPPLGPVGQGQWLASAAAVLGAVLLVRVRRRRTHLDQPEPTASG